MRFRSHFFFLLITYILTRKQFPNTIERLVLGKMAKTEKPKRSYGYDKGKNGVSSILNQLSVSLYGTDMTDDTENINDRFNDIMRDEINRLTDNGKNTFDSFLGKIYSSDRDESARTLATLANSQLQLNDMGLINPSEFITEQYKNRLLKQADAAEIANQLIELREAKEIMRDAIISADVNSGRITRQIVFEKGASVTDVEKDYKTIVENMEKKFNTPKLIKDFIVDNTLSYGEYYVYTIPYAEVFNNFSRRFRDSRDKKFGTNRFFEAVDSSSSVEDIVIRPIYEESVQEGSSGRSKNVKKDDFFEESVKDIESVIWDKKEPIDSGLDEDVRSDLKTLLGDRITVNMDNIPIPILENGSNMYSDYAEAYFEDGIYESGGEKSKKKKKDPTKEFLTKYDTKIQENPDGFYHDEKNNSGKPLFTEADVKDCYIKMIPPTRMIPLKVMDETLFYLYIQTDDATPLNTILSYTSIIKQKDPSNKINIFIDDIANRIVSKFDKAFVTDNLEFRKTIVSALEYYDLSNTKVHFQLIPKEYVVEFKINTDIDGNGHSMLEPSLFYAKLYLMLLMFNIMTILTKSNDEKINYIRTSGIDKNVFNKAQEIIRQKNARKITLNDIFSYTSIINKVGSGSEIFMPLGRNGEKPIESDILQGQDVQLHNDLMEWLRTAYILGTNVPSAIMNYLNEADFAKSIETANTKMNGRVINYQIDLNDSLSLWYQKLLRYSTDIPEEVIQSVRVILPEPKGSSNIAKQEIINNYQTLQDFLVKIYFGDTSDDNPEKLKSFLKQLAEMHLPMINFKEIDEIAKKCEIDPIKKQLGKSETDIDIDGI